MKKKVIWIIILFLLVSSVIAIVFYYPEEKDEIPEENCAKEGEMYSDVFTDRYLEHCCEGLTEFYAGMDTRISIGDECYTTMMTAGAPYGICINCGNGICEDIENVCNCPEDCGNGENSQYSTGGEFCEKEWEIWKEACEITPMKDFPICDLCEIPELDVGILKGRVTLTTGSCGPTICTPEGCPPSSCLTKGVKREISIREISTQRDLDIFPFFNNNKSGLIKIIESNETGDFEITLPLGNYSIFAVENGSGYLDFLPVGNHTFNEYCGIANDYGGLLIDCFVEIKKDQTTEFDLTISYAAV